LILCFKEKNEKKRRKRKRKKKKGGGRVIYKWDFMVGPRKKKKNEMSIGVFLVAHRPYRGILPQSN
jgi:hypothetical protein